MRLIQPSKINVKLVKNTTQTLASFLEL